ncbi:hypothetical protein ACV56Z_17485 [Staphylococcus aureus]
MAINRIGAVVPQVTHKQAARDAINQATATKRQQIDNKSNSGREKCSIEPIKPSNQPRFRTNQSSNNKC